MGRPGSERHDRRAEFETRLVSVDEHIARNGNLRLRMYSDYVSGAD